MTNVHLICSSEALHVLQALLNLGSSDPSLRSAAYNLLCTLTQTFDLKIEGQLLETAGKLALQLQFEKCIHVCLLPVTFNKTADFNQTACPSRA